MRDASVSVWTTQTISSSTTTYGPTINLLEDYVGDHLYGTGPYGLPVEIIADTISAGTEADGFTLTFSWQYSDDGNTWIDSTHIGVIAVNDNDVFSKDGTVTGDDLGLTRAKLQTRGRTAKQYARLKCVSADIEGSASVRVSAFLSTGTLPFADTGVIC